MIPEGNTNGRVDGKSGRDPKFKEAFTIRFWQPLRLQHFLLFIRTFEDVQVRVGAGVGVSNLCEKPLLPGPLSHVWVSICIHLDRFFLSLSLSLSLSLPLCLSVSLSLLPLDVSVYLSISSARLECHCNKNRDRCKADRTVRTSRAVPHPGANRALCR